MTHPAARFLDLLLDQVGDEVKYGAEVRADAADATGWDASELVEWAAGKAGASVPDGSWRQYAALKGKGHDLDPEVALRTPGALLFKFSSDPLRGIPAERQVMISLGDGRVIDLSGDVVRVIDAKASEFSHAAEIPELELEVGQEVEVRDLVRARLADASPEAPTPAASAGIPTAADSGTNEPVEEPRVATDPELLEGADPIQLHKQSVDVQQRADDLRQQAERGEAHRSSLDAEADQRREEAQAKLDDANRAFVDSRLAKLEASQTQGPEADARLEEARQLHQRFLDLTDEATALRGQAAGLDDRVKLAQAAIDSTQAEAAELEREASRLAEDAHRVIQGRVPEPTLAGPSALEPVEIVEIPPPPPRDATEAQVREWVKQRELAESSREQAATQKLREASELDDLAEVRRSLAGDARSRASAATSTAATEQARIDQLEPRLSAAIAQAERMSREMIEEQAQLERLQALGDTEGVAQSTVRVNELMAQEASWSTHAQGLRDRLDHSRQVMADAMEDAGEFGAIATTLDAGAQAAAAYADELESAAATLQSQAHQLDVTTDVVEDALGRGINTVVNIVTPEGEIVVEVPGRSTADLTPEELERLHRDLPGSGAETPAPGAPTDDAAVDADDGMLSPISDLALPEPVSVAEVEVEVEPELDGIGATVADIDLSTDALALEEGPIGEDPLI